MLRESRCMSLLPRTTLHSDSEQFIYNLETLLGVIGSCHSKEGFQVSKGN
jgi:hypothetical protein